MLINNIDISSLDIQLYDRVITSNDITTHEEWLDGDIQPTFIRQQDGFKTINLPNFMPRGRGSIFKNKPFDIDA